MYNREIIGQLVDFISSKDGRTDKSRLQNEVQEAFGLVKDRSVYYCDWFAIRFCKAASRSFGNTVLALSALHRYDGIPFIVCLVTPTRNYLMLANTTFLRKISHSSQELRRDNIKGSFNGSDIMREFEGIENIPENFEFLYNSHENYTFPQYGVRYIAINDHFDTIDPNSTDSDMAGIKNWFNEWYSKDTSRKIRAVSKAKGERGERLTTNVPYGYKRDSDDPKKWVIDEEAAQVVKRIFALCMEGKGPSQIAALLEKEKVLNPTAYKQREGRKTPHQTPENEYRWHESTVAYILEYMEYTGCTVNFKTYTNSIWDKRQRENPMENRKIFYNTHPAIISLEVFDKVQEIRQQRHRRTATGKSNMFSGLVFCNDCKQKLYYSTTSYFEKRQDFFICSTHRANKDKCSGHYIRAVVLEQIVWKHIQEVISVVTCYEAYFRSEMEQKLRIQSEESLRLHQKRLVQAEKRIGELDRLFIRIYEDNVAGRLDDERFAMMSKNYTDEQKDLKAEVKNLQQQIHEQEQQAENIEQFVQRVKRNSTLTELTPYALRELVKAVYVDAPDKSSGKRRQKVHIEYDLVGYIPVDELLKAEQA